MKVFNEKLDRLCKGIKPIPVKRDVYVVSGYFMYESGVIIGVYDDITKAKQEAVKMYSLYPKRFDGYLIQECTINGEVKGEEVFKIGPDEIIEYGRLYV